ncbi:hypothetical protein GCM10023322_72340 [Rugosimonospora acidiphila]|uniref:Uncharacterized protein n=1 Tax=Rugosimonospora acidiphila TaxID=556531 RepID=A0ABP9SLE2_9ACTN
MIRSSLAGDGEADADGVGDGLGEAVVLDGVGEAGGRLGGGGVGDPVDRVGDGVGLGATVAAVCRGAGGLGDRCGATVVAAGDGGGWIDARGAGGDGRTSRYRARVSTKNTRRINVDRRMRNPGITRCPSPVRCPRRPAR